MKGEFLKIEMEEKEEGRFEMKFKISATVGKSAEMLATLCREKPFMEIIMKKALDLVNNTPPQ